MKERILLFIFLISAFYSVKCQIPISESNSFMYNKYNYGFDFFNCFRTIIQEKNGKIIVQPDQKPYVEIGNATAKQYLKDSKISITILSLESYKGKTYLLNDNDYGLYEVNKDGRSKKLNSPIFKNFIGMSLYQNKLWIGTYNRDRKIVSLYNFDGKKIILFKSFKYNTDPKEIKIIIQNNLLYVLIFKNTPKSNLLYSIYNNKLNFIKPLPFSCFEFYIKNKDDILFNHFGNNDIYEYKNGKVSLFYSSPTPNLFSILTSRYPPVLIGDTMYIMDFLNKKPRVLANIYNVPLMANSLYSKETNSYYLGTGNNFYRLFPYIKKYPRIFNHANSQQIFSITQAKDGKIWAGSYNGKLAFIGQDKITQSKLNFSYLNFGKRVNNKVMMNTEFKQGILLFDDETHYRRIVDSANSYTNFFSRDSTFYISDAFKGIQYAPWKELLKGKAKWKKISKKQGLDWVAVDDFTEDKFGNIWGAKNRNGIFIYQPEKDKVKVFSADKKEIETGGVSLLLDSRKTVWFGSNSGKLYYYSGKNKDDLSPKNLHPIIHPLLASNKFIYSLHQWKNYLVIGASDKILLFDLQEWYLHKKVLVRYLNPMETSFTVNTEQHTMLTDFRDESIWFSTSDMLYQWDIKNWLKLPTFKVIPRLKIKKDSAEILLNENKILTLKPIENSFEANIDYQTRDNMPRYINACISKKNEKPVFENPNLETQYKFSNLSSGDYIFYVRICQQDGSFTIHKFNITVEKFLWENWWFWLLMSLFPILFIYHYFRSRREIEKRKREVAQLNVSTLSNQFRPHFMLNALNSLGTELDDKPHAEKVISRIGENINLMYDYSQEKKFYTNFRTEWKLVENTIEIQKIIFIKELEVKVKNKQIIPEDYLLPMGILQVCVENALLHGIRHRKTPPYELEIQFSEDSTHYIIDIIDNGVGRKKSEKIYQFKRKGTGLKNILALIKIINTQVRDAISINAKDEIYEDKNYPGTQITIRLIKTINYEHFKF